MKYSTLGIIGHVDHGKTSLVKALTGVDTDRLEEEKRRGISIVLGYAHLDMPSGEFGVIDAPGHEKFIRTMIAGAAGSDAVLLVVDVNEGVKPQTIEHLDIAGLLGIRNGVIAITKVDTADSDMIELATAEVRELVEGTLLESAPIVPVSAHSGIGIDALRAALDEMLQHVEPLKDEGCFYLPVDRVFTMAGHGTVITGTLRRGSLAIDDPVEIFPQRVHATVREMQSHSATVDRVAPGHRTAVNLRGLEKAEVGNGDVLATPGSLTPARFLDVELRLLERATRELGHNHVVRLLFGTKESYARLHFLDRDKLEPGETCFAQLKLEEDVSPLNLEPFVIRSYSPMHTIGGGRVLAANSGRTRRNQPPAIERMRVLAGGDPVAIIDHVLRDAGEPLDAARLAMERRLSRTAFRNALKQVSHVEIVDGLIVHRERFEAVSASLLASLREFHQQNRTIRGMTRPQLAQSLGIDVESALLMKIIGNLRGSNIIGLDKGFIFDASFNPEGAMSQTDRTALAEIEAAFRAGGIAPPMVAEVTREDPARTKLYRLLVTNGVLTPLTAPSRNPSAKNNMAFHRDALEQARETLKSSFGGSPFTTAQAKDLLNISRKYLIPLLEHFDAVGITKRAGEHRTLKA